MCEALRKSVGMQNKYLGCLLGLATGDALGAPFEGGFLERILWRLIGKTADGAMRWTDDTQMTLDLAESLLIQGRLLQDDLAIRFARSYSWSRGYGAGASRVLSLIGKGVDWRLAAKSVFREGSFGNGAAMRAPVLALFFRDNLNELIENTRAASEVTHAHAIGIDGAVLIGVATRQLLLDQDVAQVLSAAKANCRTEEMMTVIQTAIEWLSDNYLASPSEVAEKLGNGIAAHRSCATALYIALRFIDSAFDEMLAFIIAVKGDVDTIGAMAGAMWGARNGHEKLPTVKIEQKKLLELTALRLEEAANQIDKSNQSFRAILDYTPYPVVVTDESCETVEYFNQCAVKLFGHAPRNASDWFLSAYPDDDYRQTVMARWQVVLQQARASESPVHGGEYHITCQDGKVRICEFYASWMNKRFVVTANDITAQKSTERELDRRNGIFNSLIENMPVGVFMVEAPSGKPIFANQAALQILGRGVMSEATRESLAEAYKAVRLPGGNPYPPDEMPILLGMQGITSSVSDMAIVRPEGEMTILEVFGSPVTNANGKIWASLVSFLDITERKRAEKEREEMRAQIQSAQKMESIGRLAGGVAHDFNNLLTVIIGYADLLLGGLPQDDKRRHSVEEILATGNRAAGLTRQLLAFSRRQILNPKVIDLNTAICNIFKMLARLIGENIRLEMRLSPEPCFVKADAGQIDQILVNLSVNARDAMPQGGSLTVATELLTADEEISLRFPELARKALTCISVSDTGHGLTDEAREHLFEPFFTTKEVGKGTGLGLATVYGIVKQSGGEIDFASATGVGTSFRIYFPEADKAGEDAGKNEEQSSPVRGNETILLVEDECRLRIMLELLLSSNGYHVISAEDGAEALLKLEAMDKPVDLLITDILMPVMNGIELGRRVASLRKAGRTLYMSGYTDDRLLQHSALESEIAFLNKPFTNKEFLQKVREVMEGTAEHARN
ncbi:MAG: hypothetical protein CVV41_21760 [Candidatus Riflebacteria bacterium HGW-Riflebacteria-1]|nr:MAG: hypothetical protein CVV41_21760 [Candidatus Riflebacteria bacterium HGW-Riflebacteria-1]